MAIVSEDTPLLVELSVIENISLLLKYHNNIKVKLAEKSVSELLLRCGYEYIGRKKPFDLNKKDKMIAQYLRAYISTFDTIAIIKPFSMLNRIEDINHIIELSSILDDKKVEILDTLQHDFYKDNQCLTIK